MNSIPRQLATFAAGVIAGQFIDAKPHGGGTGTHANSKAHVSDDDAEAAPVRGLAVAENRLRLVVSEAEHKAGVTGRPSLSSVDQVPPSALPSHG